MKLKASRTVVGLLIAALLIAAVLLRQFNPLIVDMIVVFIMLLAGIEMAHALANRYDAPLLGFVISYPVAAIAAYIGGIYLSAVSSFFNGLVAILLLDVVYLIVIAIVVWAVERYTVKNLFATIFCLVYPMTLSCFFFALNRFGSPAGLFEETLYGATPIALLFTISALSDVFALLVGVTVKGPKLCPRISPKKTISGACGGLLGGIAAAGIILWLATLPFVQTYFGLGALPFAASTGSLVLHTFVIGILGSVFTQAGDLVASAVKRDVGIKDFGKALGSHGGVMDRIDGQLFNAFFLFVYLTIFTAL